MNKRLFRLYYIFLFFVTTIVLFGSFYLQIIEQLTPCPLCLMQRGCVFFLFFFSLMGLCVGTIKRARLIVILQVIFSLLGLYFSSRQLWLQLQPQETLAACMPSLDVLMRYFPWQDVVKSLFLGSGHCGEVVWSWMGLTLPAWSLLYFLFIGLINFWLYLQLSSELPKSNRLS